MTRLVLALSVGLLTIGPVAHAHEVRPAYLEITETARGRWDVVWRTPVLSGMRLPIVLKLPDDVRNVREPFVQELPGALVERRWIDVGPDGLAGRRIEFPGLQATITDVLVRVAMLDGTGSTTIVRPSQPWIDVAGPMGRLAVMRAYVGHGIEHILFGYDHLLFVLALILIVPSRRVLLLTITAFTIAHSITLALATLGVVHVPGPPVEAAIALSILLLAVEIVHLDRGEIGLTARWPWLVAFVFGLLHGFGFASALIDTGLPQGDIPIALFSFNVGVEYGQLVFVTLVLGLIGLARRIPIAAATARYAMRAAPYAIGALAAFWLFDRVARF